MMNSKEKKWLRMLLLFVLLARLALLPKGHFHLQDELRYRYSLAFLREIKEGNWLEAGQQLYQRHLMLRPTLVLAYIPAAVLQGVLLVATDIKTETPVSLNIPSLFNLMASLGLLHALYLLLREVTDNLRLRLTGLLSFAFLVNNNLYIRHIFPYDLAL